MLAENLSKSGVLTFFRFLLLIIAARSCFLTFSFNWTFFLSSLCFAITFFIQVPSKTRSFSNDNPFKGRTGSSYISESKENETARLIADYVIYDAEETTSLANFNMIKKSSECVFAKKAKLWGSCDYDSHLSIEENIRTLVPTFYKFTLIFHDLGLDGFVIELPGNLFGRDIKTFGSAVRKVLLTLKNEDTRRQRRQLLKDAHKLDPIMLDNRLRYLQDEDPKAWERRNWVFEFNKITFFITSFAPFYPETNSRFTFGSRHCYILFQPELSFAIHDIPNDTAYTAWESPKTVRDRIRVAFRKAGREYDAPLKTGEPMVYEILKRMYPGDDIERWWDDLS